MNEYIAFDSHKHYTLVEVTVPPIVEFFQTPGC